MGWGLGLGFGRLPSETGGSWKKSPHSTSCSPPKARAISPRALRPMRSRASRMPLSSIDTSSITRQRARLQRSTAAPLPSTLSHSAAGLPLPRPMPAHEWMVTPCTCEAAMPVGATTGTAPGAGQADSSCCIT